jgi:hypothetical protein
VDSVVSSLGAAGLSSIKLALEITGVVVGEGC